MEHYQLKLILDSLNKKKNLSKDKIIKTLKAKLKRKGKTEYDRWQEVDFDVNHLFQTDSIVCSIGALLHFAAVWNHTNILIALTKEDNVDLNVTTENEWTPLHFAIVLGNTNIVRALIRAKADINKADKNGQTPLHFATLSGKYWITKYLIDKEANINAIDKHGHTPLTHTESSKIKNLLIHYIIKSENFHPNTTNNDGFKKNKEFIEGNELLKIQYLEDRKHFIFIRNNKPLIKLLSKLHSKNLKYMMSYDQLVEFVFSEINRLLHSVSDVSVIVGCSDLEHKCKTTLDYLNLEDKVKHKRSFDYLDLEDKNKYSRLTLDYLDLAYNTYNGFKLKLKDLLPNVNNQVINYNNSKLTPPMLLQTALARVLNEKIKEEEDKIKEEKVGSQISDINIVEEHRSCCVVL
ncbi:ankyrin repeat domain-containing protein [Wolbachia endosymbiont of Pentidionis agamae]|uniref:ankyrin repeat domain-containing protein n=1 Tax=Wolbachia endosymbiont of Pentidionis agamae TaxID=3110435 RepID=UPI002FCEDC3F